MRKSFQKEIKLTKGVDLMRAKALMVLVLGLLLAVGLNAQGQLEGSKHDFSATGGGTIKASSGGAKCVFCHTPHTTAGQDVLWNRAAVTGGSITYNTVKYGGAGQAMGTGTQMCMSCHDGSVAVGEVLNTPVAGIAGGATGDAALVAITGSSRFGDGTDADFSGVHPIGITYANSDGHVTVGDEYNAASGNFVGDVPIPDGKVSCMSCHDPHKGSAVSFLRKSNANSELCETCHNK